MKDLLKSSKIAVTVMSLIIIVPAAMLLLFHTCLMILWNIIAGESVFNLMVQDKSFTVFVYSIIYVLGMIFKATFIADHFKNKVWNV